jgi:tRNA_anti-like
MKKILLTFLVLAAVGAGVGYYLWNKPVESMAKQAADLGIPATQLYQAFSADEAAANAQYAGKIVAVTGTVAEARNVDGTLKVSLYAGSPDALILCEFDPNTQHKRQTFANGESLAIKGECAGRDLDGAVQIARCVEVTQ